ncbi:hypothetical protein D3C72_1122020 [compost metagenome]
MSNDRELIEMILKYDAECQVVRDHLHGMEMPGNKSAHDIYTWAGDDRLRGIVRQRVYRDLNGKVDRSIITDVFEDLDTLVRGKPNE